jgi:hypothetical protein
MVLGMRLHLCWAPDGTPRVAFLAPADQAGRDVALRLLPLALRGGENGGWSTFCTIWMQKMDQSMFSWPNWRFGNTVWWRGASSSGLASTV